MFIKITAVEADTPEGIQEELKGVFASMNAATRAWELRAARGECGWICSSCCASDQRGMPDECIGGVQWCTDIIQRDKKQAWAELQEPKE